MAAMIVQCPGCKTLFDLRSFAAEGGVLVFTCVSCKARQTLTSQPVDAPLPAPVMAVAPAEPAPQPLARVVPVNPPVAPVAVAAPPPAVTAQPSAPEAPAPKTDALAVRASTAPVPLPEGAVAPTAVEATGAQANFWVQWNRLTADWGNPKAHEQFVAYCAGLRTLPFAGTRYREHLVAHPDDPMAKKGRDRVLTQAMVLATAEKENEPKGLATWTPNKNAVYAAAVALVSALGWMFLRVLSTLTGSGDE